FPMVTGSIGLLGTVPTANMMSNCDTLLMIGTSFPYAEYLPQEGQARAVQIDIDGKMLSLRYPVDVNLMGDSKETLKLLIPILKQKEDQSWPNQIRKDIREWKEDQEKKSQLQADPVNPQYVFSSLSKLLPDNCIITA